MHYEKTMRKSGFSILTKNNSIIFRSNLPKSRTKTSFSSSNFIFFRQSPILRILRSIKSPKASEPKLQTQFRNHKIQYQNKTLPKTYSIIPYPEKRSKFLFGSPIAAVWAYVHLRLWGKKEQEEPDKFENESFPFYSDDKSFPFYSDDKSFPFYSDDKSFPFYSDDKSFPFYSDDKSFPFYSDDKSFSFSNDKSFPFSDEKSFSFFPNDETFHFHFNNDD